MLRIIIERWNLYKRFNQSNWPIPEKRHFKGFDYDVNSVMCTTDYGLRRKKELTKIKIKIFKTYTFGKINENLFTNKENFLGCIYIVRDPRNVITSLAIIMS